VEEEFLPTPHGEKKDMGRAMAAAYNPKAVESAWDAWWVTWILRSCYFVACGESERALKPMSFRIPEKGSSQYEYMFLGSSKEISHH